MPLVLEAFGLVWGLSGCVANQALLRGGGDPTLTQMLPVLSIATGSGFVGARFSAEIIARLLPQEETLVVSREGLYGLTGKVSYPVTEAGGRILVYDDHGSLHDESCRIAPGGIAIPRGHTAIVMDRNAQGVLVVEEIVE